MSVRSAIIVCSVMSLVFTVFSARPLPRYFPFLNPDVRAASIEAIDSLRAQGYWLINMQLIGTDVQEEQICFTWEYRYRNRTMIKPPEILETCHGA